LDNRFRNGPKTPGQPYCAIAYVIAVVPPTPRTLHGGRVLHKGPLRGFGPQVDAALAHRPLRRREHLVPGARRVLHRVNHVACAGDDVIMTQLPQYIESEQQK
jgi:hypothetical protein